MFLGRRRLLARLFLVWHQLPKDVNVAGGCIVDVHNDELFLCPSNTHIEKPTFFLLGIFFINRILDFRRVARSNVFYYVSQDDTLVFETFAGVDGRQNAGSVHVMATAFNNLLQYIQTVEKSFDGFLSVRQGNQDI